MAEQDDIFGKIDALLEKRAGFAAPMTREADDFPLLTEVVDPSGVPVQERRQGERRQGERRQGERRRSPAAPTPRAEAPGASAAEHQLDFILQRLERRLEDLFIRQQLRLDDAVRQAVRQELNRLRNESEQN